MEYRRPILQEMDTQEHDWVRLYTEKSPAKPFYSIAGDSARERFIYVLKILTHSFMAPKSMSSEVENIELKSKEKNNTDNLNLSGQIVR